MTINAPEPLSVADLIAAGPTGLAAQGPERSPIGVPSDYVAKRPGERERRGTDSDARIPGGAAAVGNTFQYVTGQPTLVPPTFFEGDEYNPASESAEDRARWQKMMFDLHILNKDFQVGVWDAPTRLAYRSVLEFANGAGITDVSEAMRQYGNVLDVSLARNGGKPPRAPLVIRKSNPDDLRRAFQQAASQALGERAPDDQVERMIAAYQASEATFQRQAYDASYEGGTVIEPPTPGAFAMEKLEAADPVATQAYAVADRVANDFQALLSGPFAQG